MKHVGLNENVIQAFITRIVLGRFLYAFAREQRKDHVPKPCELHTLWPYACEFFGFCVWDKSYRVLGTKPVIAATVGYVVFSLFDVVAVLACSFT